MRHAPDGTVEAWALEYLATADLGTKLAPPPAPSAFAIGLPPLRLPAPGRPPELRPADRRRKSPRAGALANPARRAEILHRFLHHELQAAELLAWALLAFPEAPLALRRGLLAVLEDELRHLALYRAHLARLGVAFGDLPINDWFWSRVPSAPDPAHFVAVLGMGLEGGNLDHGLRFAERFRAVGDAVAADLQIRVVADEVRHVAFALRWFRALTGGVVFEAWRAHLPPPLTPMMMRGEPLNRADRRRAGFPDPFLDALAAWQSGESGAGGGGPGAGGGAPAGDLDHGLAEPGVR